MDFIHKKESAIYVGKAVSSVKMGPVVRCVGLDKACRMELVMIALKKIVWVAQEDYMQSWKKMAILLGIADPVLLIYIANNVELLLISAQSAKMDMNF
jgi:hypothetical protein